MAQRKNEPYRPGELEVILSLAPTQQNIHWLAVLLERSEAAIKLVYKIAFEHGPFGKDAEVQTRKVLAAKRAVGILVGRKRVPSATS